MKNSQKGFIIPIIIAVVALLAIGGGTYVYVNINNNKPSEIRTDNKSDKITEVVKDIQPKSPNQEIAQGSNQNFNERMPCPEPFIFDFPIDINKATSVLYPGQVRGGDFKAHGGFRFDNSRPDEITVIAPIDALVVVGARYPASGEIQYTLEFEHPCGIRYRLGHILTLTPKFQAIAEKFPMPTTLDSRTTEVRPPIAVKKGEIIATAVGLTGEGVGGTGELNTFLDWGVYDYRQKNEASKDPAWAATHTSYTYQYGVCWFDWISAENLAKVLSLPSSDGVSGKQSDFCK